MFFSRLLQGDCRVRADGIGVLDLGDPVLVAPGPAARGCDQQVQPTAIGELVLPPLRGWFGVLNGCRVQAGGMYEVRKNTPQQHPQWARLCADGAAHIEINSSFKSMRCLRGLASLGLRRIAMPMFDHQQCAAP